MSRWTRLLPWLSALMIATAVAAAIVVVLRAMR